MFRGSALEYRLEQENEIVCAECLSKRKDGCRDASGREVVGQHAARMLYEASIRKFEDIQERSTWAADEMERHRQKIREAKAKAEAARPSDAISEGKDSP